MEKGMGVEGLCEGRGEKKVAFIHILSSPSLVLSLYWECVLSSLSPLTTPPPPPPPLINATVAFR